MSALRVKSIAELPKRKRYRPMSSCCTGWLKQIRAVVKKHKRKQKIKDAKI